MINFWRFSLWNIEWNCIIVFNILSKNIRKILALISPILVQPLRTSLNSWTIFFKEIHDHKFINSWTIIYEFIHFGVWIHKFMIIDIIHLYYTIVDVKQPKYLLFFTLKTMSWLDKRMNAKSFFSICIYPSLSCSTFKSINSIF